MNAAPASDNGFLEPLASVLLDSYRHWSGEALLPVTGNPASRAEALYKAPFVVLAHDCAADPRFIYANLTAQRLFEMPWAEIVGLPSRHSAEAAVQAERDALLAEVSQHGFSRSYSGIRIAHSGRRFRIEAATVWNLLDADGRHLGQAACFAHWQPLA
jgi:hypothetical protein